MPSKFVLLSLHIITGQDKSANIKTKTPLAMRGACKIKAVTTFLLYRDYTIFL